MIDRVLNFDNIDRCAGEIERAMRVIDELAPEMTDGKAARLRVVFEECECFMDAYKRLSAAFADITVNVHEIRNQVESAARRPWWLEDQQAREPLLAIARYARQAVRVSPDEHTKKTRTDLVAAAATIRGHAETVSSSEMKLELLTAASQVSAAALFLKDRFELGDDQ